MFFRELRRKRRLRAGFSLIELLIVIAIILIILAVALPKLANARKFAQEMAAQRAIATINTMQAQYYSQYGQYATTLTQLGPPTNGTPNASGADLIDRELAGGEKGNYKFVLAPTATGYAITAVPTQFGTSGDHTFFSDGQNIHVHSGQEPATANDPLVNEKVQGQQQQAPAK